MDALQKVVLRKAAFRLVPILMLAYLLNFLDRTNISFAALTMNKQIGLSATQFGYAASSSSVTAQRVLILAVIQFGFTLGSHGLGIWLPQIIKGYGLGM